jgi:hypothetical protein
VSKSPRRVEKETGVALATLKIHYEKAMPDPSRTELRSLEGAYGSPRIVPVGETIGHKSEIHERDRRPRNARRRT